MNALQTRCPHCGTVFRVSVDALKQADGQVRCGFCRNEFSALQGLIEVTEAVAPTAEAPTDESAMDFSVAVGDDQPDLASLDVELLGAGLDAIGEEVDFEPPGRPERKPATGWWLFGGVLVVALAAQLAWYERNRVTTLLPQAQAAYDFICQRVPCAMVTADSPPNIEVLSRDVRDHPEYQDSLLVNATIVSRAGSRLPYPVLRLSLLDTRGELLASRDFSPSDYLDVSVDPDAGMLPGAPVYLVLELAGDAATASGFELSFH